MIDHSSEKCVLALTVYPRSFGFVVFEGPNRMLDWGVRSFRSGVNAVKIPSSRKLLALLDEFRPSAIVIRKPDAERRTKKWKMLITIERQAHSRRVPVRFVSRRDVNRAFVGFESNKYEVASALAKQFPSLASKLPPKRKCWQSEDYRMGIFDAAALGVAYFVAIRKAAAAPFRRRSFIYTIYVVGTRSGIFRYTHRLLEGGTHGAKNHRYRRHIKRQLCEGRRKRCYRSCEDRAWHEVGSGI
jgi:hypothetical protein